MGMSWISVVVGTGVCVVGRLSSSGSVGGGGCDGEGVVGEAAGFIA